MSYEEDLTNLIKSLIGLSQEAHNISTSGLHPEQVTLIEGLRTQTTHLKDTLNHNKSTLVSAHTAANAAGKEKLAHELQELKDGLAQAEKEFRKVAASF